MTTVIDASAIGAMLLSDEASRLGEVTEHVLASAELLAPAHLAIEVMALLIKAERDGRIDPVTCDEAWRDASGVIATIALEPVKADDEVFAMARGQTLSAQDAGYVELAHRNASALLTGDKAMQRAARALSIGLPYDSKL